MFVAWMVFPGTVGLRWVSLGLRCSSPAWFAGEGGLVPALSGVSCCCVLLLFQGPCFGLSGSVGLWLQLLLLGLRLVVACGLWFIPVGSCFWLICWFPFVVSCSRLPGCSLAAVMTGLLGCLGVSLGELALLCCSPWGCWFLCFRVPALAGLGCS